MRVPTRAGRRETSAETRVAGIRSRVAQASGVDYPLRLWDGQRLGDPALGFELVLNHPGALRTLLQPGSDLAAGEAYVLGHVDIVGDIITALKVSESLVRSLTLLTRMDVVRQVLGLPAPPARQTVRRAHLRGRRHSPERDRAAIAHHYDLPQAFYEQFLDAGLVYSCAYFREPDEPLEQAQERKLDVVCRKLRLRPGERMLDIGCGWGSLLLHAARAYGVRGVGVTLSRTQLEAGRQRIAAAGLSDRVDLRLADYREVQGQFDAVASIGMVEHVGLAQLGPYVRVVQRLTATGGRCLVHGIVTEGHRQRAGRKGDFTDAYVFPDGELFPAWKGVQALEVAPFELADVEQLRPHYALTLREWLRRLERHHDAAVDAASEVSYRVWRAFMAASAVGFDEGRLGVVQLLGVKGRPQPPLPLGRAWMLPADAYGAADATHAPTAAPPGPEQARTREAAAGIASTARQWRSTRSAASPRGLGGDRR